ADRVASLSLVCPGTFDPEPVRSLRSRVLYIHGDRGPGLAQVPRATTALPEATAFTLSEYFDALWSDPAADRPGEIAQQLFAFLGDASHMSAPETVRLRES